MKGRISALCMVAVMLMTMLGAPLVASGESMQDLSRISEEISTSEPRDYPNGWTHRPVVEVFTSLSCSPCMSNSEPQVISMHEALKQDNSQPYTIVTFHQTNGGDGDDPTASQEAKEQDEHEYSNEFVITSRIGKYGSYCSAGNYEGHYYQFRINRFSK